MSTAVSPLLLQRYELKYAIPFEMVEPISKAIEGHCSLDYYSEISHDSFYTINSLYFDTDFFDLLYHKQAGIEPSYSLRVRSYGDNPKPPYYAEIKVKQNDFSNKLRAKLRDENWAEILQTGILPDNLDPVSRGYLARFVRAINHYGARPRILTQYRRKAYLSNIDEYARVTFDRDMRYQTEEGYSLQPDDTRMTHYDHEEWFPHPDCNVILELKAEKKVPIWMLDLIRRFDLSRDSFSKYQNAVIEVFGEEPAPRDYQPFYY